MVQARSTASTARNASKKRPASRPSRAKKVGKKKVSKKSADASRLKKPPVRKRAPSLLILHLDSAKLRSDDLHLSGPAAMASVMARLGTGAEAEIVDATDLQGLLRQLQELAERKREFDVVVAVGHSNHEGIRIAADMFVEWEVFGAYLQPFAPRKLLLVACKAGGWPAASSLFQALPLLRCIYASPVNASKLLGELLVAAAPLVLELKVPTKRQVTAAQLAVVALTGCQLREWKRGDRDDPEGAMLLDLAAAALDPLARQTPALLKSLLP